MCAATERYGLTHAPILRIPISWSDLSKKHGLVLRTPACRCCLVRKETPLTFVRVIDHRCLRSPARNLSGMNSLLEDSTEKCIGRPFLCSLWSNGFLVKDSIDSMLEGD